MDEWRKIGSKGEVLEKNWLNELNNSKKEIKEKFNLFNNAIFKDKLNALVKSEKEKYFQEKPTIATRQCSMKVIEKLNNLMPNLIGGSADLSGSNNTKTSNSVVLNSKNYGGNYIIWGKRTWYGSRYEWYCSISQSYSLWWYIFNFFQIIVNRLLNSLPLWDYE